MADNELKFLYHPKKGLVYFTFEERKQACASGLNPNNFENLTRLKELSDAKGWLKVFWNPFTDEVEIYRNNGRITPAIESEKLKELHGGKILSLVKNLDLQELYRLKIKPYIHPLEVQRPFFQEPTEKEFQWLNEWKLICLNGVSAIKEEVEQILGKDFLSVVEDNQSRGYPTVFMEVQNTIMKSVNDRRTELNQAWGKVGWDNVMPTLYRAHYGHCSTFFNIPFTTDYSSVAQLWEAGLVPSYDGTVWRLHAGKEAKIVYEESAEKHIFPKSMRKIINYRLDQQTHISTMESCSMEISCGNCGTVIEAPTTYCNNPLFITCFNCNLKNSIP